jgi:protein-S-isoprenylcysteine O-methyltransferase Ste14
MKLFTLRGRSVFALYAEVGIILCFVILFFGLLGWFRTQTDILVLQILNAVGNVFYFLAIILAAVALLTLRHKGQPSSRIENTTVFIEKGIFRIIRHPLYLGLAFWSIGLILLYQSIPSTILGVIAFFCFWISSKREDEFNIKKFGDSYREYMKKVPMWNILKGLRRKQ